MNLFKRFRKSSKDDTDLFSLSLILRKYVDQNSLDFEFKTKPNQEKLIAEFLIRLRHDEDLWRMFYEYMRRNLGPQSSELVDAYMKEHYTKIVLAAKAAQEAEEDSDEPVISPLMERKA